MILDKMKVIFFHDDTLNVVVGENVKVIGNIQVVESRKQMVILYLCYLLVK